ncbi:MAG: hypothetical protein K0R44_800 [Thermomicrobiales bacterium]|nr:hypothetical protein [Thermomicrobiales bacterium]
MLMHRTTRRAIAALGSAVLAAGKARQTPAANVLRAPLRAQAVDLTGRVVWPRDPDYDVARQGFNARFSRFPAAIVVCNNTSDVQNAVLWARQEGMPLRARSGGHSYEAFSVVDGGLVVDVGGLTSVEIDVARGEAVIGAGVRLLNCYRHLWQHGVTIPAGTCPGIGIAGLTLGGGIGFLSRQYGLTCDNLVAIELVDADGRALRASKSEHPDLFWALRGGGGGNFGIATAFTFRVHPIGEVVTCTVASERGSDLGDGTVHRFCDRAAALAGTVVPGRHTGNPGNPVSPILHGRRAVCRTTDHERPFQECVVACP